MKTLGVLDKFNSGSAPDRYIPLILNMPPEAVIFYCNNNYIESFPKEIKLLKNHGIKIEMDNYAKAKQHDYLLFDDSSSLVCQIISENKQSYSQAHPYWYLKNYTKETARRIVYSHSIDDGPSDRSVPEGSFCLHPYEWSFLMCTGRGVFMSDEKGRVVASRNAKNIERVVIGMTHMALMTKPETESDKLALKKELAEKIGSKFDDDLPLIVFSYAPMDTDEANRGIISLSKKANVVIKYCSEHPYLGDFDRIPDVAGPNIFYTEDHSLNSLMRLAADLNLASYISSVFVSCVAHNLPTIPVCTHYMSSVYPRGKFCYTFYLNLLGKAYVRLARHIGPININFTDKILDKMNDMNYWDEYHAKLPELQQYVFGNYKTGEEAAKVGAHHILSVLRCGSFVTPELRYKGKAYEGEPNLNFDPPMVAL